MIFVRIFVMLLNRAPECNFSMTDVSKNDGFSKKWPTLEGTEKSKLPEMLANVSYVRRRLDQHLDQHLHCHRTFEKTLKLTTESPVIFMVFQQWRLEGLAWADPRLCESRSGAEHATMLPIYLLTLVALVFSLMSFAQTQYLSSLLLARLTVTLSPL